MTKKVGYPTEKARYWLEPGPVALISAQWKAEHNIMTRGWHTLQAFSPSLPGCMIYPGNHGVELIRQSGEA